MAGGGFAVDSPGGGFDGKITLSVVVTCIVAASAGLIFGYDIGISGGVTTMIPFLAKFFPEILRKAASAHVNMYCVYDSQVLTLFTSSLYLAGLVSSTAASRVTAAVGRRNTILLGGALFLLGGVLNGAADNIAMLILGRILLGLGVGFTNQAAPVYLSEIAPAKWRGAFNTGFQFFLGVGVVVAGCINYATAKHKWGWRLSLGLAIVPAGIIIIGAFLISDTPSSLVERGKKDQARKALHIVRGSKIDIEPELEEIIRVAEYNKSLNEEPLKTIFERQYRPHMVLAFLIPFFQQMTGINIVAFYAPNLFQSVGFGHDASLLSAIILGVVNLASILISTAFVDRFGRRVLLITGGIVMFVCQIAVAALLGAVTGVHGNKDISQGYAILVLVLLCMYTAGFGWSWGPLTWLIPSEIFPLKIRTTGQSIAVGAQFITIFILSQTFLTTLCHFKFAVFLFYAFWILVMTFFVIFFLPETKGIPLESMYTIWGKHWYWRRFVKAEANDQDNRP
ncbi:hypothetical protein TanjilG_09263 [Lupinus angustifolius]|uniref:Major facilitator superfamily (MFS) profile domain-containing protein n=1 Tax=Lupinus angustifolius TaxID=3871 RepID=A0A4P1QWX5_LUPAN|nr:PREDICTED: sugar transport protein 5 [Lupinus angustifolius]OIV96721.1 hypothetical protein TanjilG_09263 [Lupinus angustifolius]